MIKMADGELIPLQPEDMPNAKVPALNQRDELLSTVVQTGNIELLERFMAAREREEARQAKLDFNRHFAEMQSDFTSARRTKEGYGYKYAPLDVIQKAYGPIIAKHGFSYRWNEVAIEGGKRCIMTISGYGHSEENSFDIPAMEAPVNRDGKKTSNPVQIAGGMSTYGRRYTFVAGFGVIIEDEDPDADIPDDIGAMEMDLRQWIEGGKLTAEATRIIRAELAHNPPDAEKLKGYWKRAKAKCEGKA